MTQQADMPKILTPDEQKLLESCEKTIRKNLDAFIEVGTALLAIQTKRLYRVKFTSFEKYCEVWLGVSRPRAYQIIDCAKTMIDMKERAVGDEGLSTTVDKLNERQARELSAVPPEVRLEVLKEAQAASPTGEVTAKQIAEVVAKRAGEKSVRQFSFISGLEKLTAKIEDLATHAADGADLEALATTLEIELEEIRNRIKQKAA